jgi:hypothetical protein
MLALFSGPESAPSRETLLHRRSQETLLTPALAHHMLAHSMANERGNPLVRVHLQRQTVSMTSCSPLHGFVARAALCRDCRV